MLATLCIAFILIDISLHASAVNATYCPELFSPCTLRRLNWTTPMGLTMRTITLTLNDMKIVPLDVFRGKITFK